MKVLLMILTDIMRLLLTILTALWIVFFLSMGAEMFLDTPREIQNDKDFINQKIKPSVDFVKKFKQENNCLPSSDEFNKRESTGLYNYPQYIRADSDVVSNDLAKFKDADWKKDFAIGVWRGEWEEYYFSWTDKYDSNNSSWAGAFMSLLYSIIIGALPLSFWYLRHRLKK